jgi:quercetin dioxygenase-like cupin family protein
MSAEVAPRVWTHDEIVRVGLAALEAGGAPGAPLIDGRVLSIRATPTNGTSSHMAVGISVLPSGYSTPPHEHEAEELATVLSGAGSITIDGVELPVGPGSVVLTPSRSVHLTTAGPDGPLVVLWVYAPAGSEERWRALGALDDDEESGGAAR